MSERVGAQPSPLLTCLVPVRNGESELPGFLDNVRTFCDAVIVLDDGSTDGTADILTADPIVTHLIRNPPRDDFTAWNDSRNRNALLKAAQQVSPRWILSLDADERIDASDAQALRTFLETDALPGLAYGFRNAPMYNDERTFLPTYIWVYRLFHYAPGQTFSRQKLHFVPIPTSIRRDRWVKTTLRIQHLGERTPVHRMARFAKYLEADPQRRYQEAYDDSLRVIDERNLSVWLPRPASLPVLLDEAELQLISRDEAPQVPAISVAVLDTARPTDLRRTLESVGQQQGDDPFETIVVCRRERAADVVPKVDRVATIAADASLGVMCNHALGIVTGTFVHLVEAGTLLEPGSLAARLHAHRQGYAMVEGITRPAPDTPITRLALRAKGISPAPDVTPGPVDGPPRQCSYARLVLHETGGFPESPHIDSMAVINAVAYQRGYVATRTLDAGERITTLPRTGPAVLRDQWRSGRSAMIQVRRVVQQSGCLRLRDLAAGASANHSPASRPAIAWSIAGTMVNLAGRATAVLSQWRMYLNLRAERPQLLLVVTADEPFSWWIIQCDYWQKRLTALPLNPALSGVSSDADPDGRPFLATLCLNARTMNIVELCKRCETFLGVSTLEIVIGDLDDLQSVFSSLVPGTRREVALNAKSPGIERTRHSLSRAGWRALFQIG